MLDAGDQRKNKPHHLQELSLVGAASLCVVWCDGAIMERGMGALRDGEQRSNMQASLTGL